MSWIMFLIFAIQAWADEKPFRLCYFSLNNEKEFQEAINFTERLNKVSPRKIEVIEYLDPKAEIDTETAFRNMVESGVECDGLVISGHHTGAWGGKRAQGSLSIDFLENLACEEKHQAWFR